MVSSMLPFLFKYSLKSDDAMIDFSSDALVSRGIMSGLILHFNIYNCHFEVEIFVDMGQN
jgi:hypothetical protein